MSSTLALGKELSRCIELCRECEELCTATVAHCLIRGAEHARPEHISALLDCAQACQTSAVLMLRRSNLHLDYSELCADACDACATSCEKLSDGDEILATCAQRCRACSDECRRLSRRERVAAE